MGDRPCCDRAHAPGQHPLPQESLDDLADLFAEIDEQIAAEDAAARTDDEEAR